jgi:hypothetical protein
MATNPRVPYIWSAVCARCGKPQISPLRFAPVEMTKLGVIADQTFLNPIFIPMGGLQAHEHSGRDDKFVGELNFRNNIYR